ncbi:two-component system, OmpR family, sensor histidine kinase KdpD [Abditibacterium utsteinense]|uniref:Two-component system, OmpR family, sensor histidine kinase KdpD n=1 Tax=Abditibacterium utsteinense TaxID=1960156 RepID=A0A2S8SPS1_9BACT|nr:universal stress protein [Abditibacterium utsteinense]PQV62797.1 two-component system, OmpR family, sensor histidine kinase KdpD [Abditibacterium utsteinense]
MPKSPEEWLQIANREAGIVLKAPETESDALDENAAPNAARGGRGRLKIYLGFAAGVGKSYRMLEEASRRRERGQDVVIGYIETHNRAGTVAQLGELEIVPRRHVEYRGVSFEEMDTEAIIARRPQICLVDELAHTNVPGSAREKRWQDVEALLDAGITVLSAFNVQHLESLNDAVWDITGVRVRETIPDRVLREAHEVTIVDITPRALVNRLRRGDIYKPEKIESALGNFFREGNLSALREIALREVAREVDDDVSSYRREKQIETHWNTGDRILVCLSPTESSLRLLRRGWRIAQRLQADLIAVYVADHVPTERERAILQHDFALAERLGIAVVTLQGDVAGEVIRYARENEVTQLVMGHSSRSTWQKLWKGDIIGRLTRELRTVDILIVTEPAQP